MASTSGVDLSLSGLASGLDWKSLVQQLAQAERAPETQMRADQTKINNANNAYGSIKTELSVLQSRVTTLQDTSLYDSRTTASSDTTVASATASAGAANGTYAFTITQLATASKRTGTADVGKALSSSADVSGVTLGTAGFATVITEGTITVNGQQIAIAKTDTLQDVFDRIATATGNAVTASYDPATDKIKLTGTGEVVLGSATDTSNFLQVAKLYNNGTNSISSSGALGSVTLTGTMANSNLATAVSDGGSGAGEFKINGVSISYNATTDSMANVLARINSSAAGVTAAYDVVNDRFTLTSKSTGDMDITMADVTGNFLTATGLSGSTLTHGKNLLYTINGGAQQVSQSNTISDASSGVSGLSITAVNQGTTTVSVATDTNAIKTAITSFIDQYNRVQSLIDTNTASSTDANGVVTAGTLASDGDANDIAATLRRTVFSQISGLTGTINHLADLGIQTSGNDNSLTLSDSTQLDAALSSNLDSVKQLFTDPTNGIMVGLSGYLDRTIGENGNLIAKQNSLTKQASDIDTQVANLEKQISSDSDHWTSEFVSMETTQQQLNQQLSYLTKQFGSSSG